MKKEWIMPVLLCGMYTAASSQATVSPATLKSAAQEKMSYHKGTGNLITSGITNALIPVLNLSSVQQQNMNDALYDYFTAKAVYMPFRQTDMTSYDDQQNTALNNLKQTLSGFLTGDQMTKFNASKPADIHSSSVLALVFY